jgi:glucokinase
LKSHTYDARSHSSLLEIVKDFTNGVEQIDIFVVAIAGMVVDHARVTITNLPHWPEVVADEFSKELSIPKVVIINDFEANGYGVQLIGPDDYIAVTNNEPVKNGVKGVVGAGTGLGEGGHTEFAGLTLEDYEF